MGCAQCGGPISGKQTYCSRACRQAAYRARQELEPEALAERAELEQRRAEARAQQAADYRAYCRRNAEQLARMGASQRQVDYWQARADAAHG